MPTLEEMRAMCNAKQRKPMSHEESEMQISCVEWFRLQYPKLWLYAIPNGGRRSKREAGILKAEGVLAGTSDLHLPLPRKQYHGLFLEAKTKAGTQSAPQKKFEKYCQENGYLYKIFRSFDEFQTIIKDYLSC